MMIMRLCVGIGGVPKQGMSEKHNVVNSNGCFILSRNLLVFYVYNSYKNAIKFLEAQKPPVQGNGVENDSTGVKK